MPSEDLPSKPDTAIPGEYKASSGNLKSEDFTPSESNNSKNETTESENKAPPFQEDSSVSFHFDLNDFARRATETAGDTEINENLEQVRRESIKSAIEDFAATIRTSLDPEAASTAISVVPEPSVLLTPGLSAHRDCTVSSQPRFHNDKDEESISKLFVQQTDIQSLRTITSSHTSYASISLKSEQVDQPEQFNRKHYYDAYTTCKQQESIEKIRNHFLQRRIFDYYKKRQMYHVLVKDAEDSIELKKKYEFHLNELDALKAKAEADKIKVTLELDSLMKLHKEKKEEVKSLFDSLQRQELELSKEIPETNIKGHVEKIVERHLKRQKLHLKSLMKLRLSYIKCQNLFNEKQKQLNELDNLGPNLHLIDYEQLRFKNRNLRDKVEEKENELLKIRVKCRNIMQVLAHRREKTAAVEADIPKLRQEHEIVCEEYEDVREEVSQLKQERDDFRQRINKIKTDVGLVVRPALIRDLQSTMSERDRLRKELDSLKIEYDNVVKHLSKLRRYISNYETMEDNIDSDVPLKFPEVRAYVGI